MPTPNKQPANKIDATPADAEIKADSLPTGAANQPDTLPEPLSDQPATEVLAPQLQTEINAMEDQTAAMPDAVPVEIEPTMPPDEPMATNEVAAPDSTIPGVPDPTEELSSPAMITGEGIADPGVFTEVAVNTAPDVPAEAAAVAVQATSKLDELREQASEKLQDLRETASEKLDDLKEAAGAKIAELTDGDFGAKVAGLKAEASEKLEELKVDASLKLAEARDTFDELKIDATEKFEEFKVEASEQLAEAQENFEDLKEEVTEKFQELKQEAAVQTEVVKTKAKGFWARLFGG